MSASAATRAGRVDLRHVCSVISRRRARSPRGTLKDSSARARLREVLHDHVHDDPPPRDRLRRPASRCPGWSGRWKIVIRPWSVFSSTSLTTMSSMAVSEAMISLLSGNVGEWAGDSVAAPDCAASMTLSAGVRAAHPATLPRRRPRLVQPEGLMHRPQSASTPSALSTSTEILMSPVVIIFMLTSAAGQGGEHPLGDAGVRPHAGADDRHLADALLVTRRVAPSSAASGRSTRQRGRQLVLQHGEADGRPAVAADVLGDHVHDDVLLGDGARRCDG